MSAKYVIAANRWAYNSWCDRNGHKWFDHIYVHDGYTINTLELRPDQFVFVDGWETNPKAARIKAGYNAATIRQRIRSFIPLGDGTYRVPMPRSAITGRYKVGAS